jgi:hypothetical protein
MKKITTLYKKDPDDLGRVINEIDPKNKWVFQYGIPTRKFDGTSCAIIDGELYKRFDLKKGRTLPPNSIPCQEADTITGHHPHWIKCDMADKSNKYHFEAFDRMDVIYDDTFWDGTYELCGEKVQGNPEKIEGHQLIKHGCEKVSVTDYSFDGFKRLLEIRDIEGIVFHHREDGRMCKIRKSDFGIRRNLQ